MAEVEAKKTIAVEANVSEANTQAKVKSDTKVEAAPGESAAAAHWTETDLVATSKMGDQ